MGETRRDRRPLVRFSSASGWTRWRLHPPFNEEARRQAGFTRAELELLLAPPPR